MDIVSYLISPNAIRPHKISEWFNKPNRTIYRYCRKTLILFVCPIEPLPDSLLLHFFVIVVVVVDVVTMVNDGFATWFSVQPGLPRAVHPERRVRRPGRGRRRCRVRRRGRQDEWRVGLGRVHVTVRNGAEEQGGWAPHARLVPALLSPSPAVAPTGAKPEIRKLRCPDTQKRSHAELSSRHPGERSDRHHFHGRHRRSTTTMPNDNRGNRRSDRGAHDNGRRRSFCRYTMPRCCCEQTPSERTFIARPYIRCIVLNDFVFY